MKLIGLYLRMTKVSPVPLDWLCIGTPYRTAYNTAQKKIMYVVRTYTKPSQIGVVILIMIYHGITYLSLQHSTI